MALLPDDRCRISRKLAELREQKRSFSLEELFNDTNFCRAVAEEIGEKFERVYAYVLQVLRVQSSAASGAVRTK